MANRHHVSSLRAEQDETLVSFLQRAQAAGDWTDHNFQTLIAGAPYSDAWRAERRPFDWHSLSRFVNATPEELHAMSQRSLLHRLDSDSKDAELARRAPWLSVNGYSAHCPCCFKKSPHWRQTWTRPSAIVCEKHGTVLLRHCDQCGAGLQDLNWTQVRPICPACHHHLSLGPAIPAPRALIEDANHLGRRFATMISRAPLVRTDFELAHFAALWRTVLLLGNADNGLAEVRKEVLSLRGISPEKAPASATGRAALQHAENVIVAAMLAEIEPGFSQHFWLSIGGRATLRGADEFIREKLREIAGELSLEVQFPGRGGHQLTMSFANWDASNGIPQAA